MRLAIKQRVIGANVVRCLRWLKGRPSTLLLSGGAALDAEAVRIVGESVQHLETIVGTANIDGTHGPVHGSPWDCSLPSSNQIGAEAASPRGYCLRAAGRRAVRPPASRTSLTRLASRGL